MGISPICGNALAIPFPDGSFDVVWTEHASMNIPDKARLYSELARVVRHGGRLALFDILAGPNQPIHFPVPWASDESYSFLKSPEDARALITQTGFREVTWIADQDLKAEVERADASREDVRATGGLNPGLLYGTEGPRYLANVQRNSEEGRILPAMGVFERI
jgi:SAM-dependent methyltransferase